MIVVVGVSTFDVAQLSKVIHGHGHMAIATNIHGNNNIMHEKATEERLN